MLEERNAQFIGRYRSAHARILEFLDGAANRRQSPDSINPWRSLSTEKEFGSAREPTHIGSPEAEARWCRNIAALARVQHADVYTFVIGVRQLPAVGRDGGPMDRIIASICSDLALNQVGDPADAARPSGDQKAQSRRAHESRNDCPPYSQGNP